MRFTHIGHTSGHCRYQWPEDRIIHAWSVYCHSDLRYDRCHSCRLMPFLSCRNAQTKFWKWTDVLFFTGHSAPIFRLVWVRYVVLSIASACNLTEQFYKTRQWTGCVCPFRSARVCACGCHHAGCPQTFALLPAIRCEQLGSMLRHTSYLASMLALVIV